MALAIRTIPTLYGKEAEAFERAAREAEEHRGRIDITEDAKLLKEFPAFLAIGLVCIQNV